MQLDPTRLVEDNSPNGRDHVRTDLNSWHFYIDDYQRSRAHIEEMVGKTFPGSGFNYLPRFRQGTEPLINSEYGTVSAGGGDRDGDFATSPPRPSFGGMKRFKATSIRN